MSGGLNLVTSGLYQQALRLSDLSVDLSVTEPMVMVAGVALIVLG